jgi:long-chain fatty acid transport protein
MTLIFVVFTDSYATNGYFRHGYGTHYRGMAGAGIGLSLSALTGANNPGALVFVGSRYDIGLSVFNPNREYTVTGNPTGPPAFGLMPGTVESDSKVFVIPALGANWLLNEQTSIGVSLYANGGMNTNYPTNTYFGSSPAGVDLNQIFLSAVISRKLVEKHSVGASVVLSYQRFKAEGFEAFGMFSSDATKLTNNSYDNSFGYGFKLGYLGNLNEYFSIGAAYQTKMFMSKFENYAGLFAEQGKFNIPASWTAGIVVKPSAGLDIALDVQQVFYSGIPAVANPFNPANFQQGILLGDDKGSGFGWEDMTVVKGGLQYGLQNGLTLRAGYSYGKQPIPETEVLFNIVAPGVIEQHATVGFTKKLGGRKELTLAIMHGFSNSVTGTNPLDPAQTIELKMNQWEIDLGFGF